MKKLILLASLASIGLMASGPQAFASSDEAWAEFAADVEAKCLEAADPLFRRTLIAVDPIGSERFGIAIVFGRDKSPEKVRTTMVCLYDKQTKTVELGSPLGYDIIRVAKPKKDEVQKLQRLPKPVTAEDTEAAAEPVKGGKPEVVDDTE